MSINILLFSDTHGRIPLLLKLAWRFQRERDVPVDLILVTGDLGVWPDLRRLDQSTKKHSVTKPWELGFLACGSLLPEDQHDAMLAAPEASFFHNDLHRSYQKKARRVLDQCLDELTCPVVFVGGNHEDYNYLAHCRQGATEAPLVHIDQTGRLRWLPSGSVLLHEGLCIAGIDGIEAEASGRSSHRYADPINLDDDKTLALLDALAPHAADAAPTDSAASADTARPIDLLLSHDGPPDLARPDQGSPLMQLIVEALQPKYHCFGHYHRCVTPTSYRRLYGGFDAIETCGIHINKLSFTKQGPLRRQAMLHFTTDGDTHQARFVRDPWYFELRQHNWTH